MTPSIARILCVAGIATLFILDRKKSVKTSWSLWLPVLWVFLSSSRPVSEWLNGMSTTTAETDQYLAGSPLDAATYAVLLASAMVVLATRWSSVAKILRQNQPIVLFVAFCALSILWSDFPPLPSSGGSSRSAIIR